MASAAEPRTLLSRIPVIAWVFAAVVVILIAGYFFLLRSNYAPLYSDLRPSEAAAVVAELEKEGVRYRLADGGSEILAPASDADAIRLRLASANVSLNGEHGFELFDTTDLGLTDFAQKVRYQRALQGELSRTILMMDGVADARVHLSIPERTVFRGERRNAEAAVTLVMRTSQDANPARIEGIQRLVAASVPDLLASDVVVLNARGEIISIAPPNPNQFAAGMPDIVSEESISRVVRNILGVTSFEIAIQVTSPTLAGDPLGLASSQPETIINIVTAEQLSPDAADRIMRALEEAAIVDPAARRSVAFRVRALSAQPDVLTASSNEAPRRVQPSAATASSAFNWLAPAAALGVVILAVGLILSLRRKPALSGDEHSRFAEQLRSVLAGEGERHG